MIYYYSKQKPLWVIPNITWKSDITEIIPVLKENKELCIDTETTGLSPIEHTIIMFQIGTRTDQYVIDVREYGLDAFRGLLESTSHLFIGHNIKFDYNMLKRFKIVLKNVYDTMISDMVIHNGLYSIPFIRATHRFTLANTYKHHTDKEILVSKDTRNEFAFIKDNPFTTKQILYGAYDVKYPFEIKDKQQVLIDEMNLHNVIFLENAVTLALGDIEYNGLNIDTVKWREANEIYKGEVIKTEKALDALLLSKTPRYKKLGLQINLWTGEVDSKLTTINWNSDKQVYEVLASIFNVFPKDKHGKPSASKDAIELLDKTTEITELLLKYRKEQKAVTSFGEKFLQKYLSKDNRIRTTFNQIVETGRVSSRNPNLQQIPSFDGKNNNTKRFREAFTAKEGHTLVVGDYSGQESRIMAEFANDKAYIDFFNNGDGDSHSFVASTMFSAAFNKEFIVTKDNENKEYRQKGKILNFFISFGGSAFTLSSKLKIPLEEAQELIDAFYKGFPSLRTYFTKNKAEALKNGFIRMNKITNRIRFFPDWRRFNQLKSQKNNNKEDWKEMNKLKGKIERRAQNSPIQGSAAGMTKSALVLLRSKLLKLNIYPYLSADIKMCNVIHDEIVCENKKELEDLTAKLLKESMEEAGKKFVKNIEMTANPVISNHWTH